MYKLDTKDKKILYLLHQNCRLSNSQIGRIAGLSKDGVKYRITKLLKEGIIRNFFLNIRTLDQGYATYSVFLRLHYVDSEGLKNTIGILTKKKYIIYCATCFGKWDMSLQISSRSVFTFERYMEEIIQIVGDQLSNYEMFISIKEYKVYSNVTNEYFGNSDIVYPEPRIKPFKKISLDELDKEILGLLAVDARMPLHMIAKKTNNSLDVIRYRLKKMEYNGYVKNYDVLLDHVKLDYALNTIFLYMQNLTWQRERDFENFVNQNQYIRWSHKTTGQNVILIETLTNSQKVFQEIINSIKNKFSDIIFAYDSILEFENYKDITVPDLDEIET